MVHKRAPNKYVLYIWVLLCTVGVADGVSPLQSALMVYIRKLQINVFSILYGSFSCKVGVAISVRSL